MADVLNAVATPAPITELSAHPRHKGLPQLTRNGLRRVK